MQTRVRVNIPTHYIHRKYANIGKLNSTSNIHLKYFFFKSKIIIIKKKNLEQTLNTNLVPGFGFFL